MRFLDEYRWDSMNGPKGGGGYIAFATLFAFTSLVHCTDLANTKFFKLAVEKTRRTILSENMTCLILEKIAFHV